mmetsp:Transcript_18436/g.22439  ORF Transcript_18436/g.22439 Transcript_18436/m.22439 type:complete len:239 (-) Transcript_18436:125-841(-)
MGAPSAPFSNLKQTEEYLQALKNNRISFHSGVESVSSSEKLVFLSDGAGLQVDAIICCTGYKGTVDYLDDEIHRDIFRTISVTDKKGEIRKLKWIKLYKQLVYPKDHTLCCLGMFTSIGNESSVGEMQARWITALWKDELKTTRPSTVEMEAECERVRKKLLKIRPPVTEFVRYVHYMDNFASELGCMPQINVLEMLANPFKWRLLYALLFGPVVPVQYRINGQDKLDNAESLLLSQL